MGLLDKALNIGEGKQFRQYEKRVAAIGDFEPELQELDDAALRARMDDLRRQVREEDEDLDDVLEECFAIVREAGRRFMSMRHFDVQLIGGMVLHGGNIAEMKTGEGKTLTATLAVCLNALAGKGVHVVTVNDYLARRDAEWMSPIYDGPGLHLGRAAEHAGVRGQDRRLRLRHHLRHELRVRLRLPARQHGAVARGEGPARRAHRRGRPPRGDAQLRDRRRGRQHPHRRGAHAADHLRRARGGRRLLRDVRQARAQDGRPARRPRAWTRAPRRTSSPTSTSSSTRSTRRSPSPSRASPRPRSSSASTTSTAPRTATSSTT